MIDLMGKSDLMAKIRIDGWLLIVILIFLGCCRIFLASGNFGQTVDEVPHISTGMEWVQKGTYTQETLHPPLARVMAALPLYLANIRLSDEKLRSECASTFIESYKFIEKNHKEGAFRSRCVELWDLDIINGSNYEYALMLARLPMMLFYIIACICTYMIAAKFFTKNAALLAVALFSFNPTMLGYSGFVGTDMAMLSTSLMAMYAFIIWLEKISLKNSIWLAVSIALALLAKFSAMVFLPLSFLIISLYVRPIWRFDKAQFISVFAVIIMCFVVLWAGYRFSVGVPIDSIPYLSEYVEEKGGVLKQIASSRWLPMPEFIEGIYDLKQKQEKGHMGYLLGEVMHSVPWYYFPITLFCKTSLFIQVLWLAGVVALIRGCSLKATMPLALNFGLFLPLLFSNIALGVRHAIILFPFIAIVAAYGGYWLVSCNRNSKIIGMLLIAGSFIGSVLSHPYYLSYFNEATAQSPERFLVTADLDGGQEVFPLYNYIKQNNIMNVTVCSGLYISFSSRFADLNIKEGCPDKFQSGWIAVRKSMLYVGQKDTLKWLLDYEPEKRFGKTILLYNIPPIRADDSSNITSRI